MNKKKEIFTKKHFSFLFENYRDKVYSLAHKMTADKNTAEDITQDTFLKCYENIENFRRNRTENKGYINSF